MAGDREPFITEWEAERYTAQQFDEIVETRRRLFKIPLKAALRRLVVTELAQSDLLCLGIGTGQIEELAGLGRKNITGVEINPFYIKRAKQRLSNAIFVQGRMQDVVGDLPYFHTAFSVDALDCIFPPQLPDLIRVVREKTDALVAVQLLLPYPDFYASRHSLEKLSPDAPGAESWNDQQQRYAAEVLKEQGITTHPSDPVGLLGQAQRALEAKLGGSFSLSLSETLVDIGVPYTALNEDFPLTDTRAYATQVNHCLGLIGKATEGYSTLYQRRVGPPTPQTIPRYTQIENAGQFARILYGSVLIDLHLSLLKQACLEAGYSRAEVRSIYTSDRDIIGGTEVVTAINRSLQFINDPSSATSLKPTEELSKVLLGGPVPFLQPLNKPYNIAEVRYLVASN